MASDSESIGSFRWENLLSLSSGLSSPEDENAGAGLRIVGLSSKVTVPSAGVGTGGVAGTVGNGCLFFSALIEGNVVSDCRCS